VNAALQKEPATSTPLPSSHAGHKMEDILVEWEQTYNLGQYVSRQCNKKSHWPQSMRQSLFGCRHLYSKIVALSENTNFWPNIEEE
jgi:hypothetical protein